MIEVGDEIAGKRIKQVTFLGEGATVSSYDSLKQLKGIRFNSRLPETFGYCRKTQSRSP